MEKNLDSFFSHYQDYIEVAKLVGQVKLLKDRENRMNEKYIEVIQEKAQIKAAFDAQQKELELLKDKLNKLENQKTFWDV